MITFEEFIKKANIVHKGKYNYEKANYINTSAKIEIICPKHGIFLQRASSHLRGQGCPICAKEKITKTTDVFIGEAKKIHGNKYDYSKTTYTKALEKTTIICPKHGEFQITPSDHLKGSGCPKCAGRIKSNEDFINNAKEVHGNKYDYSKTIYEHSRKKVIITCPKHGDFIQRASAHLDGQGCPVCANNQKKSKESFIADARKIHGDKYDYSKVEYTANYNPVIISCPIHGDFSQTPHAHLNGSGCPNCINWKLENEIEKLLNDEHIQFEKQKKFEKLKYKGLLKCDFYLPKQNIIIECQGEQHFKIVDFSGNFEKSKKDFLETKLRDKLKKEYCEKNGIKLIYYNHLSKIKTKEKIIHTKTKLLKEIYGTSL